MDKLLGLYLLFSVQLAQIPTDYPPVQSREIPDHLQDEVTWFVILGGVLLVLLLAGYFMRLDKKMARWFKKDSY